MGVAAQAQGAMLPQRNGGHSSRKCIVDASGVSEKDSAGSRKRACALHTVTSRNSRRRKGSEPPRQRRW